VDETFNAGVWNRLYKATLHIHVNIPDSFNPLFKGFEVLLNDVLLGVCPERNYENVCEVDCTPFLKQGSNKLLIRWICEGIGYCPAWTDYLLVELRIVAYLGIPPPPKLSWWQIILILFGGFVFLYGVKILKGK
jgi:hypothetical protein